MTAAAQGIAIRVCTGSGCAMNGSLLVADRLEAAIEAAGETARMRVVRTGCHGLCERGPIVVVDPAGTFYPCVDETKAARIAEALLGDGATIEEYLFHEPDSGEAIETYDEIPFNRIQHRVVLRNCGVIDPESLDEAIEHGAYAALRTVLDTMSPERLIDEIEASGLRGRGGAGFTTGLKWRFTRQAPGDLKYVICNADEGDPGAFMDRSIVEGDPHSVLEGMAIAAYAVGATEGRVYVRAEYPLAVKRMRKAIVDAEKAGLLGKNISGTDFSFDVRVREGAGAFVCGEETALIASIEGERGMPRPRPPFPATSGLWSRPTCINNVETLANIGWIVNHGAAAYAAMGAESSKGTKVFALTGKVRYTGLVEVPMGLPIQDLVYTVGGGSSTGYEVKAVQIGGPSGGCLPAELFDTPIAYDTLASVGAIVGSGGVVVVDERTCMVELARYFLSFTQEESCGKCVPCRVGTKRMLEIVTRITEGKGEEGDTDLLERLALDIQRTSLCGLGQTAPNPVLTTLRYYRHEFDEHIAERRCRAGECNELSTFVVDAETCTGCAVCKKHCPVDAIVGELKELHTIDADRCIKCGVCVSHCPFDAISRV